MRLQCQVDIRFQELFRISKDDFNRSVRDIIKQEYKARKRTNQIAVQVLSVSSLDNPRAIQLYNGEDYTHDNKVQYCLAPDNVDIQCLVGILEIHSNGIAIHDECTMVQVAMQSVDSWMVEALLLWTDFKYIQVNEFEGYLELGHPVMVAGKELSTLESLQPVWTAVIWNRSYCYSEWFYIAVELEHGELVYVEMSKTRIEYVWMRPGVVINISNVIRLENGRYRAMENAVIRQICGKAKRKIRVMNHCVCGIELPIVHCRGTMTRRVSEYVIEVNYNSYVNFEVVHKMVPFIGLRTGTKLNVYHTHVVQGDTIVYIPCMESFVQIEEFTQMPSRYSCAQFGNTGEFTAAMNVPKDVWTIDVLYQRIQCWVREYLEKQEENVEKVVVISFPKTLPILLVGVAIQQKLQSKQGDMRVIPFEQYNCLSYMVQSSAFSVFLQIGHPPKMASSGFHVKVKDKSYYVVPQISMHTKHLVELPMKENKATTDAAYHSIMIYAIYRPSSVCMASIGKKGRRKEESMTIIGISFPKDDTTPFTEMMFNMAMSEANIVNLDIGSWYTIRYNAESTTKIQMNADAFVYPQWFIDAVQFRNQTVFAKPNDTSFEHIRIHTKSTCTITQALPKPNAKAGTEFLSLLSNKLIRHQVSDLYRADIVRSHTILYIQCIVHFIRNFDDKSCKLTLQDHTSPDTCKVYIDITKCVSLLPGDHIHVDHVKLTRRLNGMPKLFSTHNTSIRIISRNAHLIPKYSITYPPRTNILSIYQALPPVWHPPPFSDFRLVKLDCNIVHLHYVRWSQKCKICHATISHTRTCCNTPVLITGNGKFIVDNGIHQCVLFAEDDLLYPLLDMRLPQQSKLANLLQSQTSIDMTMDTMPDYFQDHFTTFNLHRRLHIIARRFVLDYQTPPSLQGTTLQAGETFTTCMLPLPTFEVHHTSLAFHQ